MYKNNLLIAFLLLSVLFAFSETRLSASEVTQHCADSLIIVLPLPDPNPNIPRSPSIVPISASYESLFSSVILSFNQNLGEIEVEVLNTFTGYYDSGFINTQFLSAIVPVTGGPGHYIITFTLPSGQQYQGEFDV
jgi:hypothetical protein